MPDQFNNPDAPDRGRAPASGPPLLAIAVRQCRKQSGFSLADLAARVGCAKSWLSAIENNKRIPSDSLLEQIERSTGAQAGMLVRLAEHARAPDSVLDDLAAARADSAMLARLRAIHAEGGLDEAYRTGEFQRLIEDHDGSIAHRAAEPIDLPFEVPLINKVTAGYPTEFTDLGYPARVADDYVRCPDINDADAFAARVVGDSMEPDYREGDIVVFSPVRDIGNGDDCFARLESGDESTFKRVYFERDGERERIRLQPINSRYAPRTYDREDVAGLYRAVQVMRSL